MRVAIVPFQFPVISETFVINIATGLIDRGHDVGIFPLFHPQVDSTAVHPIVKEYNLLKKTYFPPRVLIGRKSLQLPNFLRFLSYAGLESYDIVHFQFGAAALDCLPLRSFKFFKGKWVVSFRGFDISSFLESRGQQVYDQLFQKADLFLSNSDLFRNRLIKLGCDPGRAFVYRSGIDCRKFSYSERSGKNLQTIKLLSVGRLVEKKGVEYGIRAAAQFLRDNVNIEYLIIGDGPLKPRLQKLIDDYGLGKQIKLVGSQDQNFIIQALKDAHILISSGVTADDGDQNGPDNTIKEAMATGLPVIASRTGAIEEVVQDERTGFLVSERNADDIVKKIKYLLGRQEIWPSITKAAREFVEKQYNLNLLTDELIARYQWIIQKAD